MKRDDDGSAHEPAPLLICASCQKSYKTKRGYENHVNGVSGKCIAAGGRVKCEPSDSDKTKSQQFCCEICDKEYKSAKSLKRHIAVHTKNASAATTSKGEDTDEALLEDGGVEDISNHNADEDLFPEEPLLGEAELIEMEEVASYFELQDEEEEALRNEMQASKPNLKAPKKKPLVVCKQCKKKFSTLDGYVTHLQSHAFIDLFRLKVPSLDDLRNEAPRLYEEALMELRSIHTSMGSGPAVSDAAKILLQKKELQASCVFVYQLSDGLFTATIENQSFILPSDRRTAFTKGKARFLVDTNARSAMLVSLNELLEASSPICNLLLPCIVRIFASKLMVYIIQCVSGKKDKLSDMWAETSQSVESIDFKQNMHYIGGSNVGSVLRPAEAIQNPNEEWKRLISCLKNNFISNDSNESPSKELIEWTEDQNRGGLIILCSSALDFFIALGRLVKPLERLDGSLYTQEVIDTACSSSEILVLWDKIIKGTMSRTESFKLLHALCSHFCVTWRNGIISRRMDAVDSKLQTSQKGKSGLAFRATL